MDYPEDFEEVWKFLGSCGPEGMEWKRRSVKKTAYFRWKSLKKKEKADAIRGIPLFIAEVKDARRFFPMRQFCWFNIYLMEARWENLIDAENERLAERESAQDLAARRAQQTASQLPLALVIPMDERKLRIAEANLALINQNKKIIAPVVEECCILTRNRESPLVAKRRWAELRKKLPYLPEAWQDVKFG